MIFTLTSLANETKDTEDYAYVNSSIESHPPDKGSKAADKDATVSEKQEPQRPLSQEAEQSLLVEAFADLFGVVNVFLCLTGDAST